MILIVDDQKDIGALASTVYFLTLAMKPFLGNSHRPH